MKRGSPVQKGDTRAEPSPVDTRKVPVNGHPHATHLGGQYGTSVVEALSTYNILRCVVRHLEQSLSFQGRARRQSMIAQLALVSKAWVEPINECIYRNPFFGTAERAAALYESIQAASPRDRKTHIKKLIFGEGSNVDILEWPTPHLVPDIVRAATNLQIIGFDGLHGIDMDDFKSALVSLKDLRELRVCDQMPEPWCYVGHFVEDVLAPCHKVTRFRIYNLASESDTPEHQEHSYKVPLPLDRQLENVAFNHCSINHRELRNVFHASRTSLKSLYLEYPTALPEDDLLALLAYIGQGLRSLTVHNFADGLSSAEFKRRRYIVEDILHNCPKLEVLNFPEAMADSNLPNALVGTELKLWAFACTENVRPGHWLRAFQESAFPRNASCRVYVKGWTTQEIRHVRVEAHKIGLNWLTSGTTLTELCEDLVF